MDPAILRAGDTGQVAEASCNREVRHEYTRNLPSLLEGLAASLLVSTYQAGKVVTIAARRGELALSYHNFERVMGLAIAPDRIAVGTKAQVWFLRDAPELAPQVEPSRRHDACYLTRSSRFTGEIQGHEMAWSGDDLWVVNTAFRSTKHIPTYKGEFMKLTTSLKWLLFFVLMLGAGSRTSAGPIYDAAGDFSTASNPNAVWSYGTTGTTLTGPLTLYTNTKSGIGGIPNWIGWEGTEPMFGDNFPLVGKNTSSMTEMSSGVVVLPGQLVMSPAPDGSYAIVRFTAPTSGSFLLNTAFEGRESVSPGSTSDVHVLLNGVAASSTAPSPASETEPVCPSRRP